MGKINLFTDVSAAAHLGRAARSSHQGRGSDRVRLVSSEAWVVGLGKTRRRSGGWLARRHGSGVGPERRIARRISKRLIERIHTFNPDVIMAHTLGRIICYDAFSQKDKNACVGRYLVTFGSRIANPFLKAAHFTATARVHN